MKTSFIFGSILVAGILVLDSAAAPTSLLEVIFSGSAVPEAKQLIYKRTPISWILAARNFGKIARQNLTVLLEQDGQESAEKLALYAEHLNKCSFVDQHFMESDSDKENAIQLVPFNLAIIIGFDHLTANLFGMPMQSRRLKIGTACARNELRLQCALGFYRNRMDKIKEHIEIIKEQDGIFKVMLESECQIAAAQLDSEEFEDLEANPKRLNSIFECVHEKAHGLAQNCAASLEAYNQSRVQMNERMHGAYEGAMNVVERRLARATESGEEGRVEKALRNGEAFLKRTLTVLGHFEASKCRRFSEMMECMGRNIGRECGQHPAKQLETMLKIGYLRRERGDALHSQFSALSMDNPDGDENDGTCQTALDTTHT